MSAGRIILLNGTSSSGKTTIARALLDVLPTPYYHLSVDVFNAARGQVRTQTLADPELDEVLHRMRAGYHRCVAAMAHAGNDVVADYPLSEPWRLRDCLACWDGLPVLFVGVRCPLPELRRRERTRGDRTFGQAEAQYDAVHAHGTYDLEIDTSVLDPESCARAVADVAAAPPTPSAFERLRRR